jgi:hypothetical protein
LMVCCQSVFDWYNHDGFAFSKTMGISNLSLSLSHEYHHGDSLQLMNGKDGTKQHSGERVQSVRVFALHFGVLAQKMTSLMTS